MCGYYIPPAVRTAVINQLERGTTNSATIAGALYQYEFAVQISHRINIIDEIKTDYYENNPDERYTISETPISEEELTTALEHAPSQNA